MKQNNYLGTEKVAVLLKQFAIPCIFSLIISCLYNIVDQIFVGNGVGYLGNAATGVIFPITVIGAPSIGAKQCNFLAPKFRFAGSEHRLKLTLFKLF